MQGWIRAIWRFFYFAVSTSIHIIGFLVVILFGKSKKEAGARLRRKWLRHVPARMGMRLEVEGIPYRGTCLYVANHIGYIDPFMILINAEANVVAKAEVLKWPLVGLAGYLIGTIFVKRENKSSRLETAGAIRTALEEGTSIIVFPEGTTTAGPHTIYFRPRSFEAAHLAGVPVQPVALLYEDSRVAYINDDTFIPHFFRLFQLKEINCRVRFGPLLTGEHTSEVARRWIDDVQVPQLVRSA